MQWREKGMCRARGACRNHPLNMQICNVLVVVAFASNQQINREVLRGQLSSILIREQPRRRRQQKPHKFAYLTMKNSIFALLARAFFFFWHFEDVLVLSTTWNDLFCSCVDDVSIWWQMFNFVFSMSQALVPTYSRIVRTHFSRIMTLNNWKIIAETQSYIFRWRSRFRRRRLCLSSLFFDNFGPPCHIGAFVYSLNTF